jgi:hypothetical protein
MRWKLIVKVVAEAIVGVAVVDATDRTHVWSM